jgi:undecaprenyl pyrophosphate synthase
MDVQAFNTALHYDTMAAWLKERESFIPSESDMPRIGYVIFNDHFPVAMAFLRRVEGNIAQLDGLCTNPSASSKERHEAIWLAVEEVMKACKELKIKHVMSFSTDAAIIDRSSNHGFSKHPAQVIYAKVE